MKDVMLDIETPDNKPGSAILSIGAVFFDLDTGETGEEFFARVDLQSCLDIGLTVNADTLKWWMGQSKEAQEMAFGKKDEKGDDISYALTKLYSFLGGQKHDNRIWGNGATFDNVIVETAWRKVYPADELWKFWNSRDVRTIVDLGERRGLNFKKTLPFVGVPHDPIDDAKHQIKYIHEIWKNM